MNDYSFGEYLYEKRKRWETLRMNLEKNLVSQVRLFQNGKTE